MNASHLKPIAVAIALALPCASALADSSSPSTWDNVKSYSANAWHKTTEFLMPKTSVQTEPQRYGRAGGYVGADQITFLNSNATTTNRVQSTDAVKTGEVESYNAPARVSRAPDTSATPDTRATRDSTMQPEEHDGRTSGDRFDNPEGTQGQSETGR